MWIRVIIPLGAYEKWFGESKAAILPVEEGDDIPMEPISDTDGVLEIASKGGISSDRFGEFCRKNLCMESWDFIVEAVQYQVCINIFLNRHLRIIAPSVRVPSDAL